MNESDQFSRAMQEGIWAHAAGDYVLAFCHRMYAFGLESPQPVDRGRAARDVAASFDRIGNFTLSDRRDYVSNQELAEAYAEYAYRDHKELRDSGDSSGAREFTVSAMYAGILAARRNLKDDALRFMREGYETSQKLRQQYGKPHQYDVNLIGRVAGIEGLFGGKHTKAVVALGKEAVSLAKISETNEVLGSTNLSSMQVKRAQTKALRRGRAARVVIALQRPLVKSIARPISNKLVQNVIL